MKNRFFVCNCKVPMRLQIFAEGDGAGAGEGSNGGGSGTGGEGEPGAGTGPMSFDDFLKGEGNQAEFDRRVQKAIDTAVSNAQQKWQALTDDRLSEAEKLAKMNKEEKAAYMQQKKEKELSDREAVITRKELMAEAKNTLAEKKLPVSLAEVLNYADADTCNDSISAVEKAFQEAAINTLAAATIFQQQLDKIAVQDAVTGWMDANAGQVKYNGGAEVKIPKMSVQGMGDYDRDNGYQKGSVTLEYETRKMTQDRGRKFQIDPMDVDESNFIPTAAAIMAEFQRTQVIPEIDAYRISKIASEVITANKAGMVEYNYTPGGTGTSALRKVKEGIKAVRSSYNGPLVIHATPDFLMELELELAGKIRDTTFSQGGINTTVPGIDNVPIISTPTNRMYTAITVYDGKTGGQEAGGYTKGSKAKDINFLVIPRTTPIAITKQDIMRIFDPLTNQNANAWAMDYRRYHDLWILDNKLDSVFVNIKDANA